MTKPMIRIHNVETNEIVDREMTDIEFDNYKKAIEESAKTNGEALKMETDKAALLVKLGITADEAKLLLS